jgi:hypothetical protein
VPYLVSLPKKMSMMKSKNFRNYSRSTEKGIDKSL